MYKEIIYDIQTGEIIEKDYSPAQMKEVEQGNKEAASRLDELQKKKEAKLKVNAKLAALGLTEDEIAAL